jgi:hypothetical protein
LLELWWRWWWWTINPNKPFFWTMAVVRPYVRVDTELSISSDCLKGAKKLNLGLEITVRSGLLRHDFFLKGGGGRIWRPTWRRSAVASPGPGCERGGNGSNFFSWR